MAGIMRDLKYYNGRIVHRNIDKELLIARKKGERIDPSLRFRMTNLSFSFEYPVSIYYLAGLPAVSADFGRPLFFVRGSFASETSGESGPSDSS